MELLDVSELDTVPMRSSDRDATWNDFTTAHMAAMFISTLDPRGIMGRQLRARFDRVSVTRIRGEAHSVQRGHRHVDQAPSGMHQITLVASGSVYFQDLAGMRTLGPGDALVFDMDRPYSLIMSGPSDITLFHVPSMDVHETWLPSTNQESRRPAESSWSLDPSATQHLRRIATLDGRDPAQWARNSTQVLSTLPTQPQRPALSPWTHAAAQAVALIRRRATIPGFRMTDAATELNYSPRHLRRLLATQGWTFSELVLATRLENLERALSHDPSEALDISHAVHSAGFSSLSHGFRSFRAWSGHTPQQYRHALSA